MFEYTPKKAVVVLSILVCLLCAIVVVQACKNDKLVETSSDSDSRVCKVIYIKNGMYKGVKLEPVIVDTVGIVYWMRKVVDTTITVRWVEDTVVTVGWRKDILSGYDSCEVLK